MEKQELKDALGELYDNKKIRIGMGAAAVGVAIEFSSFVLGDERGVAAGILIGLTGATLGILGCNDIHNKYSSEQ